MRSFLAPSPGQDLEGNGNCRYKFTPCYIEIEYAVDDGCIVVYLIPDSPDGIMVATCWDHCLDGIEHYLGDKSSISTFIETWPLTAQLLSNGTKERYSEGALIRMADCDTGDVKWFLSTFVGNFDLNNPTPSCRERLDQAQRLVIENGINMLQELTTREPDKLTHYARSVFCEVGKHAGKAAMIAWSIIMGWDSDI